VSASEAHRKHARETPDAVGRGVIGDDPDGPATLFVLAGPSLGSTAIAGEGSPHWYDLRRLVNLDAVGDDVGGRVPIEAEFDDGETIRAQWPEPFCDKVVTRLRELLDSGQMAPRGADAGDGAVAATPSVSERAPRGGEPIEATATEGLPLPQPSEAAPSEMAPSDMTPSAAPFPAPAPPPRAATPASPPPAFAPTAGASPGPFAPVGPPPGASEPGADHVAVAAAGAVAGAAAFAPPATPGGPGSPPPAFSPPAEIADTTAWPSSTEPAVAEPAVMPADSPAVAPGDRAGVVADFAEAPPAWSATDTPLPGEGPALATPANSAGDSELVLHDVVYHGGYPGQTKRRKKCTAVLNANGLAVSGPSGPDFKLAWDTVTSIEAQNADEAKFRLNIRPKRNSTALVFDCEQGVAIVLEARDVPTLPLRGALTELLAGRSVRIA